MTEKGILAIDPGNAESGAVILTPGGRVVQAFPKIRNGLLLDLIENGFEVQMGYRPERLVIEMPKARGMPTANQEFETCVVIGWFEHAFGLIRSTRIYRHEVKSTICDSQRAKDGHIAAAIRDLYPQTGGGSKPAVGTKKDPGPLYGVSKDAWQALAVGLTYLVIHYGFDLNSIKANYYLAPWGVS
jgi:hypothetical protein